MKIKKDADYFELLSKMVACTHEAARKLHELVVVYDQVPERCGEIHDICLLYTAYDISRKHRPKQQG